jgi:hypothetical protein
MAIGIKWTIFLGTVALAGMIGMTQAQDSAAIGAPVMGFVFDSAGHALRPVLGIPGASLLGEALDIGATLSAASISPRQDYALALTDGDQQVRLVRFPRGSSSSQTQASACVTRAERLCRRVAFQVQAIDGIPAAPDRVLLSPAGSSAAFYYASAALVQVLTGLPDAPVFDHAVDVSSVAGLPAPAAISDDGQLLLTANPAADAGGLLLFTGAAGSAALPVAGSAAAIAFRAGSDDALVATEDDRIWLARSVSGQPAYQILLDRDSGFSSAVAVEFAASGSRIYAVSADGGIVGLDVGGGTPALLSCQCKATGLIRLNGGTAFRLNDPSGSAVYLLDAGGAQERVVFVPPAATLPVRSAQ